MPRYIEFRLRNERYEKPAEEVKAGGRNAAEAEETDFAALEAEWDAMQWKIVRVLEDFPEAKKAVLAVLDQSE